MNTALKILNEETPKEFFKRRGMRGNKPLTITAPDKFESVPIGYWFVTDAHIAYKKATRLFADYHRQDGSVQDSYRFMEHEVVYPLNWTSQQIHDYKQSHFD